MEVTEQRRDEEMEPSTWQIRTPWRRLPRHAPVSPSRRSYGSGGGAALGALMEKLEDKVQLKDVLVIYEKLRKERTTRVVKGSTALREIFSSRRRRKAAGAR